MYRRVVGLPAVFLRYLLTIEWTTLAKGRRFHIFLCCDKNNHRRGVYHSTRHQFEALAGANSGLLFVALYTMNIIKCIHKIVSLVSAPAGHWTISYVL